MSFKRSLVSFCIRARCHERLSGRLSHTLPLLRTAGCGPLRDLWLCDHDHRQPCCITTLSQHGGPPHALSKERILLVTWGFQGSFNREPRKDPYLQTSHAQHEQNYADDVSTEYRCLSSNSRCPCGLPSKHCSLCAALFVMCCHVGCWVYVFASFPNPEP